MKVFNALEFIFLGLYYVLYCVAHWVFAMKYWVITCKMEIIENGGLESKLQEQIYKVLYYGIIFLNIAIPIYEAVEEGMDLPRFSLSFYFLIGV